jgi:hypothetical protein
MPEVARAFRDLCPQMPNLALFVIERVRVRLSVVFEFVTLSPQPLNLGAKFVTLSARLIVFVGKAHASHNGTYSRDRDQTARTAVLALSSPHTSHPSR